MSCSISQRVSEHRHARRKLVLQRLSCWKETTLQGSSVGESGPLQVSIHKPTVIIPGLYSHCTQQFLLCFYSLLDGGRRKLAIPKTFLRISSAWDMMLESSQFFSSALTTTCGLTKPVFSLTWRVMPIVKRKWERELTLPIRKVSSATNYFCLLLVLLFLMPYRFS